MQYGSLLKQVRKLSGLSQEKLAEKMYMPRSTISKVENNKMELKLSDAIRWFQASNAPDALVAMLCGVDVASLAQFLSLFFGGVIKWM